MRPTSRRIENGCRLRGEDVVLLGVILTGGVLVVERLALLGKVRDSQGHGSEIKYLGVIWFSHLSR